MDQNRSGAHRGGLGAISVLPDVAGSEALGILLLAMGFATAVTAYRHWALNERSMRLQVPLPVSRLPMVIAIGTALVAFVAAIMFVVAQS